METVTIFTSSSCPICKQAKMYLQSKNIPFEEKNTTNDKEAQEELKKLNLDVVPVIVANDKVLVGFKPEMLDEHLKDIIK